MHQFEEFRLVSPTEQLVYINTDHIVSVIGDPEGGTNIYTTLAHYYVDEDYIEVFERLQ